VVVAKPLAFSVSVSEPDAPQEIPPTVGDTVQEKVTVPVGVVLPVNGFTVAVIASAPTAVL
jgi:hypothetical protein